VNRKGIILISTLWIIAILSLLAVGIGSRMSMEMRLSRYDTDRMKAIYLANAGIAKCQDILLKDINYYDTLRYCGIMPPRLGTAAFSMESVFKDTSFRDGGFTVMCKNKNGNVFYGMTDEERKVNINMADRKVLVNIFGSQDIADAVMDWRGTPLKGRTDAEMNSYYNSLPNPYKRKKSDFMVIEEALLVKGVTPEIFNNVKWHITVYGEGRININTASKKVLLALGMTEPAADSFIQYRNGPDGIPGTEDDSVFTDINIEHLFRGLHPADAASIGNVKNLFKVKSNYFKVESTGAIKDSKVTRTVTAILQRDDKCGGKLIQYRE
jgi:type II secretory pathway component PulK